MKEDMEKITHLTKEKKESIIEYGTVLRGIHERMVREGYFLSGGKIWNIFKCGKPVCEVELDLEINV